MYTRVRVRKEDGGVPLKLIELRHETQALKLYDYVVCDANVASASGRGIGKVQSCKYNLELIELSVVILR